MNKVVIMSEDFDVHTKMSFSRLHGDQDMSDVTLVSDDLGRVNAHRVVLSLSSPFFSNLLKNGPVGGSTLLYLGGISHSQLMALVSFIYLGKVEVAEEDMEEFNKICIEFKVLGQHLKKKDDSKVIFKAMEFYEVSSVKEEVHLDEKTTAKIQEDNTEAKMQRTCPENEVKMQNACPENEENMQEEYSENEFDGDESNDNSALVTIVEESPIVHTQDFLEKKLARIKALSCDKCEFKARDLSALGSHKRRFHENEWPCDRCGLILHTEGQLKKHIRIKHESLRSQGKCDVDGCYFESQNMGKLNIHKKQNHGGDQFYCDQCSFSSWFGGRVKTHKESKHEGKRHYCEHCVASFPFARGLNRHKTIVHDGKRVQCPHCEYQTTTNGNLKVHVNSKHEGKRYSCDICGWTGSQKGSLKFHKEQKHKL